MEINRKKKKRLSDSCRRLLAAGAVRAARQICIRWIHDCEHIEDASTDMWPHENQYSKMRSIVNV